MDQENPKKVQLPIITLIMKLLQIIIQIILMGINIIMITNQILSKLLQMRSHPRLKSLLVPGDL